MPTATLAKMARRVCEKNMDMITDLGDAPYPLVRPLLLQTQPQQLYELERSSPQIIGHDAEIWKAFIKRDIENWTQYLCEPTKPAFWYKVYRELVNDQQARIERDEQLLKRTLDGIKSEKDSKKSRQVELAGFINPPRGIAAAKEVITLSKGMKRQLGQSTKLDSRDPLAVVYAKENGRLKTPDGTSVPKPKSMLSKFRKEAAARGHFQRPVTGHVTRPLLGKVAAAPSDFARLHRDTPKPFNPKVKAPEEFIPKKCRIEQDEPEENANALERREKRLKTAKSAATPARRSTSTSSSIVQGSDAGHRPTAPVPSNPTRRPDEASSGSASTKSTSTGSPLLPLASTHHQPPSPQLPRAPSSSRPGALRPVMRKKTPANIFMPVKKQRVH